MTCNVRYSEIDVENLNVIYLRTLVNRLCYKHGADNVRNTFQAFREDGRRFRRTKYSHANRIAFQEKLQWEQGEQKSQFVAYASSVVVRNARKALAMEGEIEEKLSNISFGELFQEFRDFESEPENARIDSYYSGM